MPGPAPQRNARRRNVRPDWRTLPAGGREGMAPVWPMSEQSEAEQLLWLDLWRTPQAVAWFELGWTRTVARYARLVCQSEFQADPDAGRPAYAEAALLGEIRQIEDRLGLSPLAMRRLQWEIEPSEVASVGPVGNVAQLFG